MDEWITIILILALMIVGAVSKSKEKARKQARKSVAPRIEEEEVPQEDYFEKAASQRAQIRALDPTKSYDSMTREELLAQKEEFFGEEKEVHKEKIKVDAKKMIIYSELLKPKFLEN